jgi:hypothetical protein
MRCERIAPVTIADRFVTAIVSTLAALGTVAVIGLVTLAHAGDVSSKTFWWTFLYGSGGFVVLAAVVGFLVGPERAAIYWGLIWNTENPEEHRWPVFIIALLVILFCLVIILK